MRCASDACRCALVAPPQKTASTLQLRAHTRRLGEFLGRRASPDAPSGAPLSPTPSQGFKHFSLYLRGREELLVTVFHGDDVSGGGAWDGAAVAMESICEANDHANGGGNVLGKVFKQKAR